MSSSKSPSIDVTSPTIRSVAVGPLPSEIVISVPISIIASSTTMPSRSMNVSSNMSGRRSVASTTVRISLSVTIGLSGIMPPGPLVIDGEIDALASPNKLMSPPGLRSSHGLRQLAQLFARGQVDHVAGLDRVRIVDPVDLGDQSPRVGSAEVGGGDRHQVLVGDDHVPAAPRPPTGRRIGHAQWTRRLLEREVAHGVARNAVG